MSKKAWICLVSIILVIGSSVGLYMTKDLRTYNKAEKLFEKGDYKNALLYYSENIFYPDYDTNKEKRKLCAYPLANKAEIEEDWKTALEYYEELDEDDKVEYCKKEWLKEYMSPILNEYGLTDADLIEVKYFGDSSLRPSLLWIGEETYGVSATWRGGPIYHSNKFGELGRNEKEEFFKRIYKNGRINGLYTAIVTDNTAYYAYSYGLGHRLDLIESNTPYSKIDDFIDSFHDNSRAKDGGSLSSSSSSGNKCTWCNGTGSVRYNYGGSDLEAILSGHDPYTYGQCGSCGGTGRAR